MKAVIALLFLSACASGPYVPPRYERQSWATMGIDEAYAFCRDDVQKDGGSWSIRLCMAAKGWQQVP